MVPSEARTPPPRAPPFCLAGGERAELRGRGLVGSSPDPAVALLVLGWGDPLPRQRRGTMYIKQVRPVRSSHPLTDSRGPLLEAGVSRRHPRAASHVSRLSGSGPDGDCGGGERPRPGSAGNTENWGAPLCSPDQTSAGRWSGGGRTPERCGGAGGAGRVLWRNRAFRGSAGGRVGRGRGAGRGP